MLKYIAKRLVQSVITLFIIITIIFCLLRMMPEEGYLGANYDKMSEVQRETILTEMGLRDPVPVQLWKFYKGLLHRGLRYLLDLPAQCGHYRNPGGQGPHLHPHGPDGGGHLHGGGHPPGGADDPL